MGPSRELWNHDRYERITETAGCLRRAERGVCSDCTWSAANARNARSMAKGGELAAEGEKRYPLELKNAEARNSDTSSTSTTPSQLKSPSDHLVVAVVLNAPDASIADTSRMFTSPSS